MLSPWRKCSQLGSEEEEEEEEEGGKKKINERRGEERGRWDAFIALEG